MKPKNVNPSNFEQLEIIYDNDDFSIAYGIFEKGDKCIAMRWNGHLDDPGYPKTFGHPMWFIIDNALKNTILKSLLFKENTDNKKIIEILKSEI
jgi:hypothetical protein